MKPAILLLYSPANGGIASHNSAVASHLAACKQQVYTCRFRLKSWQFANF